LAWNIRTTSSTLVVEAMQVGGRRHDIPHLEPPLGRTSAEPPHGLANLDSLHVKPVHEI